MPISWNEIRHNAIRFPHSREYNLPDALLLELEERAKEVAK
jgi:hypothetical protein